MQTSAWPVRVRAPAPANERAGRRSGGGRRGRNCADGPPAASRDISPGAGSLPAAEAHLESTFLRFSFRSWKRLMRPASYGNTGTVIMPATGERVRQRALAAGRNRPSFSERCRQGGGAACQPTARQSGGLMSSDIFPLVPRALESHCENSLHFRGGVHWVPGGAGRGWGGA